MNHILLVFIDGIGLGPESPTNPFSQLSLPGFEVFSAGQAWTKAAADVLEKDRVFRGIDACLGLEGLPQSGTGQATLFSGVNCAELAGRHYGPYPHTTSLPILKNQSIFARLKTLGATPAFVNAYPPVFFKLAKERNRWPVTTRCCLEAGIHIRTLEDLRSGRALSADITGAGLQKRFDTELPVISENEAALRLAALASDHPFTAFEYFYTDRAGHRRSNEEAVRHLHSLNSFLDGLASNAKHGSLTVLVTSDHGNLEDLSIRTHTRNPVPFAAMGPAAASFSDVRDLTGIVPGILNALFP